MVLSAVSVGGIFLLVVFVGFLSALIPAAIADRKGHNSLLFFVFGLFAWPFALAVALLIEDKNADRQGNRLTPRERMDQIDRLVQMRDDGVLTHMEFEAEKARVMRA